MTQNFIKRTLPVIQIEVLARIYELVSGTFGSQDSKEHNYLKNCMYNINILLFFDSVFFRDFSESSKFQHCGYLRHMLTEF